MSDDLKAALGAGDNEAFPGHTMYPPGMPEIREAQERCARDYVLRIEKSALVHGKGVADVYRQQAASNLRAGFDWGGQFFNDWAMSRSSAPFLAWLLFRKGEPAMTEGQAIDIVGVAMEDQLQSIWCLWRYRKTKKEVAEQTRTDQQTGSASGKAS